MKPLPERVPSRVAIEALEPEIDAGRFAVKRTIGEEITVSADVFTEQQHHHDRAALTRQKPSHFRT